PKAALGVGSELCCCGRKVCPVPPECVLALAGCREQRAGVGANRLEHPVAVLMCLVDAVTEEALVQKRLEGVEISAGHDLRCFESAAPGEDRERAQNTLLLGNEEVV